MKNLTHINAVPVPYYFQRRPGLLNDVVHRLAGFESEGDAYKESELRQNSLFGSGSKASRDLGVKLQMCGRPPCGSAACPRCFRQYRRWLFAELSSLKRHQPDAHFLTIVYYDQAMTDEQFFRFDPKRLRDRLHQQLNRVDYKGVCVGGMEIDYHTETGRWLPHFHLLVLDGGFPIDEFRSRFFNNHGGVVGRGAKVDRPVHMTQIRNVAKQLSYLLKFYCSRVETWTNRNGYRRTAKYRLKPRQLRLSLRVFDRIEYRSLFFLHGGSRVNSEIRTNAVNDHINGGG